MFNVKFLQLFKMFKYSYNKNLEKYNEKGRDKNITKEIIQIINRGYS